MRKAWLFPACLFGGEKAEQSRACGSRSGALVILKNIKTVWGSIIYVSIRKKFRLIHAH